jgi:predicted DNA-binding protein YlxM (UPF0122 family)
MNNIKKKVEKKSRIKELMDVYPGLLTEKEKRVLKLYMNPGVSGSDVARELEVSRQAVHDHIKRALDRMESCEQTVNFLSKRIKMKKDIETLIELINSISEKFPVCKGELEKIRKIAIRIKKNS